MIIGTIGLMFGSGGSALIAKFMGMKEDKKARKVFSQLTYTLVILSIIICILGYLFMPNILHMLGANGVMFDEALVYGKISLLGMTFFILQYYFQALMITAGHPTLNFMVTIGAGITNMVLDYVFIVLFGWGVSGAALATISGQFLGGMIPIAYFAFNRKGALYLGQAAAQLSNLWQTCLNGASELMTNLSQSLIGILFNWQLLRLAGEDGVASYGVLMYVSMIFGAFFYGYSIGIAPVISYKYGANDKKQLHELYTRSIWIVLIISLGMFALAEILAPALSDLFTGYDQELYEMTLEGFYIFSFAFLAFGISVFGSAFFTALNNGPISALISFVRTVIFQVIFILILPQFLGIIGIWLSVPAAELFAALMTCYLFKKYEGKYGYGSFFGSARRSESRL